MRLVRVCEDRRGFTEIITSEGLGQPELTLFFTKEGCARGGCVHPMPETFTVVSGLVDFHCGNDAFTMSEGQKLIPANTAHYFVALSDCVVMEWGVPPERKNIKDAEFKAIVDEINASNQTGI